MDEFFGLPIIYILAVLAIAFAFIAAFLVFIALRDPILVRMALRNVTRRPARTALIVVGLMLATAIISIAFTTGDSVTFSIKRVATDSLRSLDETIRIDTDSPVWEGVAVPDEFPETIFDEVEPLLEADPNIDGFTPALIERVAVIDTRSRQFEVNALLTGLDPTRARRFEALLDSEGVPVDLASLGPGEVYIDSDGAEEMGAQIGDTLQVAVGPGDLRPMVVKGIADGWYFKRQGTSLVLMLPLADAQALLGREGQLSRILISNRGDTFGGEALTQDVVDVYGELPVLRDAGLEVFDLKRTVVEEANQFGSQFVAFFTTFGLFSIGVGVLLIFLIFSMLAAERKGEMGVSRAVGMQRHHLVRMFTAEGAIYGIGSAIVGVAIGIGLGFILVILAAGIFASVPGEDDFTLSPHVEATSVVVSFLLGSVITLVTVLFASRRTSRLNIVRAIRDIPEPQLARTGGTVRGGIVAMPFSVLIVGISVLLFVLRFIEWLLRSFLGILILSPRFLIERSFRRRVRGKSRPIWSADGFLTGRSLSRRLWEPLRPIWSTYGSSIWGTSITYLGVFVLFVGFQSAQYTLFGLGVSMIALGGAMNLRWWGASQRLVLTIAGMILLVFWLLPPGVFDSIRDDWNRDITGFFAAGVFLVTGAVLVIVNNSRIILGLMVATIGRFRRLTPVVKSAVAYPLRFGFRTGLSLAMFAVVIFSVVVIATLIGSFNRLFDDQQRLAGGYEVIAFAQSDLNPVPDLGDAVEGDPDLSFVTRVAGRPSVGTLRAIFQSEGKLVSADDEFAHTSVTGIDEDFIDSTEYQIQIATPEYTSGGEVDAARIWRDLRDKPGLAVVNAALVPSRNGFGGNQIGDDLRLDVEGLFLENDTMEPVEVTVRDLKSGAVFDLTVIAAIDGMASGGPIPVGLYTSTGNLIAQVNRDVAATHFFFNVEPGSVDPAPRIEAAFFQHGLETLDVAETIEAFQAAQRAFFDLLIGFMTLGLVVGVAALGVISARAVVERRHEIGVMRAIGFSRRMVQASFLAESSFISILGIGLGLALGIGTSINFIANVRTDEPAIQLVIPWTKIVLIAIGGYLLALLTTYLPSRQAAGIPPADALRYE